MPAARYKVNLHALAPDATEAGSNYADVPLEAVPEEQLRQLLTALDDLARRRPPAISARPCIRINAAARMATITPIDGKLYYSSWDTKGRGLEVSVDDVLAKFGATAKEQKPAPAGSKPAVPGRPAATNQRRFVTIALLGVAIVAMNAATLWMLFKPHRTILPPYAYLSDAESDALLSQVAGAYQTGVKEGDRRLEIETKGLFHFAVYGRNRALRREHLQSGRGARIADGAVIITSESGVLRLVNENTITIYGDTYRRIAN